MKMKKLAIAKPPISVSPMKSGSREQPPRARARARPAAPARARSARQRLRQHEGGQRQAGDAPSSASSPKIARQPPTGITSAADRAAPASARPR